MKVSEITEKDIADYLRLSEVSEEDKKNIELFLNIAKNSSIKTPPADSVGI